MGKIVVCILIFVFSFTTVLAEDFYGPSKFSKDKKKYSCSRYLEVTDKVLEQGTDPTFQAVWNKKTKKCVKEFIERYDPSPHAVIIHFKGSVQGMDETREILEGFRGEGTIVIFTADQDLIDPPPIPPDPCDKKFSPSDGFGGFLWKPESDHGQLVVLFPNEYQDEFERVTLWHNGKTVENLFFTGFANGNRQHWRSNSKGETFPNGLFVIAKDKNMNLCWKIKDTSERVD